MEENLPPGFRFHPTDEELIIYYLTKKVTEFGFATRAIADVDFNKCEPWDLPGKASMGEKEWYFYSMKDRKYPTGLRTNRATDSGYWKTTGKDKEIFHGGVLVGMKKTLVFYKGRAPKGEKTCWVMHEYRLNTRFPYKPTKEEWVVCRVFRKSNVNNGAKKQQPDSPASPAMPALLLESPCNTTSVLSDLDVSVLSNLVNTSSYDGMQTRESVINNSNRLDMNMYMSWVLAREATCQPSLPWGSGRPGLMAPTPLALQPQGINDIASLSSFVAQQGGDDHALYGNDSRLSFFPASSSKGVECAQQQQIQSLNQESLWRGH